MIRAFAFASLLVAAAANAEVRVPHLGPDHRTLIQQCREFLPSGDLSGCGSRVVLPLQPVELSLWRRSLLQAIVAPEQFAQPGSRFERLLRRAARLGHPEARLLLCRWTIEFDRESARRDCLDAGSPRNARNGTRAALLYLGGFIARNEPLPGDAAQIIADGRARNDPFATILTAHLALLHGRVRFAARLLLRAARKDPRMLYHLAFVSVTYPGFPVLAPFEDLLVAAAYTGAPRAHAWRSLLLLRAADRSGADPVKARQLRARGLAYVRVLRDSGLYSRPDNTLFTALARHTLYDPDLIEEARAIERDELRAYRADPPLAWWEILPF